MQSKSHGLHKDVLEGIKEKLEAEKVEQRTKQSLQSYYVPRENYEMKLLTVMLICIDLLPLSVVEGEGCASLS